jgi:hypothetical protein
VVLATGFGALCLFWTFGPRFPGVPGPFAFASVTWGDSLALPAMTGLLVYAVRALPPARSDRAFAVTAAALAGAAGATSQAVWLADADPRPNWTLTAPHHFTAAGWYHSAFVTVFCAALAALLALALNRATFAHDPPRRALLAAAAAVTCGLTFAALLAADAGITPGGAGLAGVLLAVPIALLTAAVLIARRARSAG